MRSAVLSSKLFETPQFPLAVRRIRRHMATKLHRHEFHELVAILSGHGRHVTEVESYDIGTGDVFLISDDLAHGYTDMEDMELVNILFEPKRLHLPMADLRNLPGYHALFRVEPKLRRQHKFQSRLSLNADDLAKLSMFISQLETELASKPPGYRFMACTHLMNIIGHLSRCYSNVQSPKTRPLMQLSEVLTFMEKNYREPISLETLAKVARMSVTSLVRTFGRTMGRSPIDHLIRIRVSRASELLQHDDIRITEAGLQCGFSDSNYFSRQFHKIKGVSPREFRASMGRR